MIIISKKKMKADGIFFIGENSNDVTGSQILIKFNGKQILLECGLYQSNTYLEAYKVNSRKFKFNPSEIDYCFINHPHIDHVGLLGRLVKEGFKGKIISNSQINMLLKPMLLNSAFILDSEARMLSKKYQRNYQPIYTEDDVYKVLDYTYAYDDYDIIYKLDDVVSFRWLKNSHCVGARQLQLIITNNLGIPTSILYTSDIGGLKANNHYVENTEIPSFFNKISIMESTYGEKKRISKKTRVKDTEHLKVAIQTVLDRDGKVVIPCFSFSRTQEILTTIYELFHNDKSFDVDVCVDSKLSCEISDLYNYILSDDDLKLWQKVYNWERVKFIDKKDESVANVKDKRKKICISSSGFCTNGRIISYLQEYLKDTNNMVIFTGYVGNNPSYLSYRIKNYKENPTINFYKKSVANKADCISLSSFSSHANHNDLVTYGSNLNTERIVLVHGSKKAKSDLQKELKVALSKNDKTARVVCSTKDMVIHL